MSSYFDFELGTMPEDRDDSGNGAGKGMEEAVKRPGRFWQGAEGELGIL